MVHMAVRAGVPASAGHGLPDVLVDLAAERLTARELIRRAVEGRRVRLSPGGLPAPAWIGGACLRRRSEPRPRPPYGGSALPLRPMPIQHSKSAGPCSRATAGLPDLRRGPSPASSPRGSASYIGAASFTAATCPVRLADVRAFASSTVMRDVDLLVSVAPAGYFCVVPECFPAHGEKITDPFTVRQPQRPR